MASVTIASNSGRGTASSSGSRRRRRVTGGARHAVVGCSDAHGTGQACAPEAAVAVRHLKQVLLVIVLGEEERAGVSDLCCDRPEAGTVQYPRERNPARLRGPTLPVCRGVDRRAVLGTGVVALPHALGRVVSLPEHSQQLLIAVSYTHLTLPTKRIA